MALSKAKRTDKKWTYSLCVCALYIFFLYYRLYETRWTKKSGQIILFMPWAQRKSIVNELHNVVRERTLQLHQFLRSLCVKSSLNYFRFLWFTFQGLFWDLWLSLSRACLSAKVCVFSFSFHKFITIQRFVRQQSGKKSKFHFSFFHTFHFHHSHFKFVSMKHSSLYTLSASNVIVWFVCNRFTICLYSFHCEFFSIYFF